MRVPGFSVCRCRRNSSLVAHHGQIAKIEPKPAGVNRIASESGIMKLTIGIKCRTVVLHYILMDSGTLCPGNPYSNIFFLIRLNWYTCTFQSVFMYKYPVATFNGDANVFVGNRSGS
jgi:hypothetical protein